MRQCFRIMNMPDRVIAFDELPKRLLEGFELCPAAGFPRHWKEWLGKTEKITKIPPEKDFLTGQVRRFDPIIESDAYFYLVDWTLNPVMEKWKEVCDFVRQHVDKDVRLMEKLEDMALPLAANKTDGVTLEPEEVPVIPIPLQFQEKTPVLAVPGLHPMTAEEKKQGFIMCGEEGCKYEASGPWAKNSIRMHKMKRHPKKEPVAAA